TAGQSLAPAAPIEVAPVPDVTLQATPAFGDPVAPTHALQEMLDSRPEGVHIDAQRGVPTFLWLTHPREVMQATVASPSDVPGSLAPTQPVATPDAVDHARAAILEQAALYGLRDAQVRGLQVDRVHDIGRGPLVVHFVREVDGVAVHGQRMAVLLRRQDLRPVAISGYVSPHAVSRAAEWSLDAEAAATHVFDDLDVAPGALSQLPLAH